MENKILAIVVTYFPERDLLEKNISAFIDNVDKLLFWENTPEDKKQQYRYIDNPKIEYCGDGINSISHALNYAWHYAETNGYDYLLTMDQDSVFENFESFLKQTVFNQEAPLGIWGPNAYYDKGEKIVEHDNIITSGMLIKRELLKRIGGWNELFNIDCVDDDFCLRAKAIDIKSFFWESELLFHNYGTPTEVYYKGKKIVLRNYSPKRLYNIYKSHVLLLRLFPQNESIKLDFLTFWIPNVKWILLFEKNKIMKIISIILGFMNGKLMRI